MTKSTPQQSMDWEELRVAHGNRPVDHQFGAECELCDEVFLDNPVTQRLLLKREQEVYEKGKADGRNEYYFDSPEYLVKEAHSLACTLAQRWNQGNYNNSMKSFREEQTRLSNELVSITKKIKNLTQQGEKEEVGG